jgi:DNA-binding response OmpR family regulator
MSARILVLDDSPTIRKVVASILRTRDYEPVLAADGEEGLAELRQRPVDLVLLDFVMPRMNGYQFCRELRADVSLQHLPVVLMSAKGDKIRAQFVQQTGAIDAITKPFDARGLIAVVEGALQKQEAGRAPALIDISTMPTDEAEIDATLAPRLSVPPDPGLRRVQAVSEFAAALKSLLLPEPGRLSSTPFAADAGLGAAIDRAVNEASMGALATLLRTLDFGNETEEALAGDLKVISIAEVLQLLELQKQSGALTISMRKSEITLYVERGLLEFAAHRGLRDEFLLGRYLVDAGVLEREELQHVLDNRAGSQRLIGETLVELELAAESQLRDALVRQASELVYEVVRWNKGRFRFITGARSPAAERAQLGLSTGSLVMEGFRRVDEWQLIEGSFDFNEVLYRDEGTIERMETASELTPQERSVLEHIDGERTVREIVDEVGGSSFELCKILYQFLNSRLVRRRAAA